MLPVDQLKTFAGQLEDCWHIVFFCCVCHVPGVPGKSHRQPAAGRRPALDFLFRKKKTLLLLAAPRSGAACSLKRSQKVFFKGLEWIWFGVSQFFHDDSVFPLRIALAHTLSPSVPSQIYTGTHTLAVCATPNYPGTHTLS